MSKYDDEIKLNVAKAIANLQAAKEWLQDGQYEQAASGASESARHTARALLLDEEIESSQHGDVISLLQEVFVNGRRLTKEQGANIHWLFAMRNVEEASMPSTAEDAHKAVQIAESFFEAAKVILEA